MKKLFFIFLIINIIFISSCEDKSVPVINEVDFTEDMSIEQEIVPETEEENDIIIEIPEVFEINEIGEPEELIYNAPYTVDEIIDIFNADKELFEKIKDIKMPDGCNYFLAKYPCEIQFYYFSGDNATEDYAAAYDINENSEYKLIDDLFNKYNIYFVHAIDPNDKYYLDENIIASFSLQMIYPDSEANYIPWAEIRYNRNSGEIKEEINNKYIIMPLDDHWYYIYSNIYFA